MAERDTANIFLQAVDRFSGVLSKFKTQVAQVGRAIVSAIPQRIIPSSASRDVEKQTRGMSKSFFAFRDNVVGSLNSLNNSFFVFFRRLARIRTAFFLIITFLGVRPIVGFFRSIIEQSGFAQRAMEQSLIRYQQFKDRVAEAAAPALNAFLNAFVTTLEKLIGLLARHPDAIRNFFAGLEGVADTFNVLTRAIALTINQLREFFGVKEGQETAEKVEQLRSQLNQLNRDIEGRQGRINSLIEQQAEKFKAAAGAAKIFRDETLSEEVRDRYKALFDTVSAQASKLGIELQNLLSLPFTNFQGEEYARNLADLIEQRDRVFEELRKASADPEYQRFLEANIAAIDKQISKLGDLKNAVRNVGITSKGTLEFADGLNQALGEMAGKTSIVTKTLQSLSEVLAKTKEGLAQLFQGLRQGLVANFQNIYQAARELGINIQNALQRGLSDTFLQVMDRRFSTFKEIIRDTLRGIQRAFADFASSRVVQGILGPLLASGVGGIAGLFDPSRGVPSGAIPAGTGSPFGPNTTVRTFQHGGVAKGRQLAVVGEVEEAFVPLRSGRIPVEVRKQRQQGSVQIIIAPQVTDGPSFGAWLRREKKTIQDLVAAGMSGDHAELRRIVQGL